MASNQKNRCAGPSLAAVPTQLEPTTNTICVRTRSPKPSGFFSTTLCRSTLRSARSNSDVIVEGYIRGALNGIDLSSCAEAKHWDCEIGDQSFFAELRMTMWFRP